jgi:hypothetical protein
LSRVLLSSVCIDFGAELRSREIFWGGLFLGS